jgi:hypothetical protein
VGSPFYGPPAPKITPAIKALQAKLSAVITRESRAQRNGNRAAVARLAAKEQAIRDKIAALMRSDAQHLAAVKAANQRTTSAAIATRDAIQRKQLSVTVVNQISVASYMSAQNKVKTYKANGSYVYANNGHGH